MTERPDEEISFLPPFLSTRVSVLMLGWLFLLTAAVSWLAVGAAVGRVEGRRKMKRRTTSGGRETKNY